MFKEVYESITKGNKNWNSLKADNSPIYSWDENSTYIHNPPFFQTMGDQPSAIKDV